MQNSLLRFTNKKFLPIAWFLLIVFLLCLPGSDLPHIDMFQSIGMDKFVHIFLFGMLVLLWNAHYSQKEFKNGVLLRIYFGVFLLVSAFGITMEFVQYFFIPNRDFEIADILADVIGASLAYGFTTIYLSKSGS